MPISQSSNEEKRNFAVVSLASFLIVFCNTAILWWELGQGELQPAFWAGEVSDAISGDREEDLNKVRIGEVTENYLFSFRFGIMKNYSSICIVDLGPGD